MDTGSSMELSLPEYVVLPLFTISKASDLKEALETLVEVSRTAAGRADLAVKSILPKVLQLSQSLSYPSNSLLLLLSLKLLRNLCAGETANQNSFIECHGVQTVLAVLDSIPDSDYGIMRMGLQVLANVVLAGKEHQRAVWNQFFPDKFVRIARVQRRETCDPLCMIIYTCLDGNDGLVAELWKNQGLAVVAEIVKTTSVVGFGEDWFKLLLSRICLEEPYLLPVFTTLVTSKNSEDIRSMEHQYVTEQAFLLSIISEILNERLKEIAVTPDFALCILELFKEAVEAPCAASRNKAGLPTGCTAIDVLGYSLTILRDICAQNGSKNNMCSTDAVEALISAELLEMLLCLLRELEPPSITKKGMKQGENHEGATSGSYKPCPYRGFRRDIVAVIGNCSFQRKHVQDEIRQKNGILLLLQQCVTDEDNPFLREWGIWSVRNLLEGNVENQRAVAELELQGSVDVPELSGLGLRVEVDQKTRRAKLVNVT